MCQDLFNNNLKRKGYSLIEVILCILYFSIIAISLSAPLTQSLNLAANDQNEVRATVLARKYVESVKNAWSDAQVFDVGTLPATTDYTNNGEFNIEVKVSSIEQDENDVDLIKRLNVIYRDKNNNLLMNLFYDINRPPTLFKL